MQGTIHMRSSMGWPISPSLSTWKKICRHVDQNFMSTSMFPLFSGITLWVLVIIVTLVKASRTVQLLLSEHAWPKMAERGTYTPKVLFGVFNQSSVKMRVGTHFRFFCTILEKLSIRRLSVCRNFPIDVCKSWKLGDLVQCVRRTVCDL